jgi:hypothetical protein
MHIRGFRESGLIAEKWLKAAEISPFLRKAEYSTALFFASTLKSFA